MPATSKKPASTAASHSPARKPAAKKIAAEHSESKTAAKKPTAAKKTAVAVSKTSSPKAERPAATAKIAPAVNIGKTAVTHDGRYSMIATAAYFIAEKRGFAGNQEMQDWISGEREIDAMLNARA